ncbi:hypothetical protein HanIR_Chr10g0465311 [Helianthus annuus]|nr:hypothetical protein HanIR_Chr10g0465311 [Helianthus annuus]
MWLLMMQTFHRLRLKILKFRLLESRLHLRLLKPGWTPCLIKWLELPELPGSRSMNRHLSLLFEVLNADEDCESVAQEEVEDSWFWSDRVFIDVCLLRISGDGLCRNPHGGTNMITHKLKNGFLTVKINGL